MSGKRDDIRIQRRGVKVVSVWVKADSAVNAERIFHQARMDQLSQDLELTRFDYARGPFESIGSGWMAARRIR